MAQNNDQAVSRIIRVAPDNQHTIGEPCQMCLVEGRLVSDYGLQMTFRYSDPQTTFRYFDPQTNITYDSNYLPYIDLHTWITQIYTHTCIFTYTDYLQRFTYIRILHT